MRPEEFEEGLEKFIDKAEKLKNKLALEEKVRSYFKIIVPHGNDGVGILPSGMYFGNLEEKDFETLDGLIQEWKDYAEIGIESYPSIMEPYAEDMEKIYGFLSLRYKPFLNIYSKKKQIELKLIPLEERKKAKEMENLNQNFYNCFKKAIEDDTDDFEVEEIDYEGLPDEEIERLERENKDLTDKDIEEMKENLNIEAGLRKIEMEYEEKKGGEIKELETSLRNYFTNEKATKLYELMELPKRNPRKAKKYREYKETEQEKAFWQIVSQGMKNRERKKSGSDIEAKS